MMGELDQIRRIAEDVYQSLSSGYCEEFYCRAMQAGLRGHTSPSRFCGCYDECARLSSSCSMWMCTGV